MKISKLLLVTLTIFASLAIPYLPMTFAVKKKPITPDRHSLLSDPFLQLPTKNTINVVWFTEFSGERHLIQYGEQLQLQAIANMTKLSRVREDQDSQLDNPPAKTSRDIWRHEAVITNLIPNQRVPYRVESIQGQQTIYPDLPAYSRNTVENTLNLRSSVNADDHS